MWERCGYGKRILRKVGSWLCRQKAYKNKRVVLVRNQCKNKDVIFTYIHTRKHSVV